VSDNARADEFLPYANLPKKITPYDLNLFISGQKVKVIQKSQSEIAI
jgi:hypothetical protein